MSENQFTVDGIKSQAKALRAYLTEQGLDPGYSKSLEAVSRSHGFKDWNTASAAAEKRKKFWERCPIKDAEIETTIYAPVYVGWQKVGGSALIPGNTAGVVRVVPTISPFFEPKAVAMLAVDASDPSTTRRFTVGAVTVGGSPQLAINTLHPQGGCSKSPVELISDMFDYPHLPQLVNWSVFSTAGLGRELDIAVFNKNDQDIEVFACVWGNAVTSLDCYAVTYD